MIVCFSEKIHLYTLMKRSCGFDKDMQTYIKIVKFPRTKIKIKTRQIQVLTVTSVDSRSNCDNLEQRCVKDSKRYLTGTFQIVASLYAALLSTHLQQRVNPCLCVYAKRFCPYSVRYLSDSSPLHARLPSGEENPKKPVETLSDRLQTAIRAIKKG
jgi:hypothetical protein